MDWAPPKRMTDRITHEVLSICRVAYDFTPKPGTGSLVLCGTIDGYHSSLPSGLKQLKRKVRLCSINVESPFLKPPVRRRFNRNILLILLPAHARVLEPGMNSCSSARLNMTTTIILVAARVYLTAAIGHVARHGMPSTAISTLRFRAVRSCIVGRETSA